MFDEPVVPAAPLDDLTDELLQRFASPRNRDVLLDKLAMVRPDGTGVLCPTP